ncbi:hypothetical protein [Ancylobacter pratisalsi]|uniref:Uncharacterized protein n=1 Tax=Ancylobacter pratisalsi TaxID=1745854 RepID=A0A6P1YNX1_9HYPH|nr:hypothetical protein [Ancylobacter pratisalsi]QIB35108.1 hypothetical protein G3A50_16380 [Ancylobacter pratisalsi]
MSLLLGLLAGRAGRAAGLFVLAAAMAGGLYVKGRSDGRAACLAQGERDVTKTIQRADRARAAAERRNADERRLRDDDTFRRN